MTATPQIPLEEYRALVGQAIGASRWFLVDQSRIDGFAEITEDRQFIHVDPQAAQETTFGGTVAHGFLSLSLLSAMANDIVPVVRGTVMAINYGVNRVRFIRPVASGERIRGVFRLMDCSERRAGEWQSTFSVTVEIEGADRPALVVEWLTLAAIHHQRSVALTTTGTIS